MVRPPMKMKTVAYISIVAVLLAGDAFAQQGTVRRPKEDVKSAKESFAAGQLAVKRQDWQAAYNFFKDAVKNAPRNVEYRYQLALAYEKLKKPANAWYQLRQAVRGKGDHPRSTQRFLYYWSVLAERGAMDVGKTREEVVKLLGKPDKAVKQKNLERCVYGFMSVNFVDDKVYSIINLRGFTDDGFELSDLPNFLPSKKEWVLKQRRMSSHRVDIIYRHKQDTKKVKTRLVILRFIDGMKRKPTIAEEVKVLKAGLKKSAANLVWVTEHLGDRSARFEYRIPAEGNRQEMHEISKALFGREDIHRISVIRRGGTFSQKESGRIHALLANVSLIKASKKRKKGP